MAESKKRELKDLNVGNAHELRSVIVELLKRVKALEVKVGK